MSATTKIEPSLIGALAKALPELEGAKKNKANPAFKSKYADLGAVIDALEPLRAHGIWFRQVQHNDDAGVLVETLYIHESGQELSAGLTFVPASKRDAQGYGSAMSYARRYGLQSAFGLATEDDDGNAAVKAQKEAAKPEPARDGPVSDAEWAIITDLIERTNADAKAFCQAFKVASVKELPANQFERARTMLNKKLAAMTEGEPA